jgi:TRAP transporter TatT component family protein
MVADLPIVEAMIDVALELDADFGSGAIHSFLMSYELNRQVGEGDAVARSRKHFERAVALGFAQLRDIDGHSDGAHHAAVASHPPGERIG